MFEICFGNAPKYNSVSDQLYNAFNLNSTLSQASVKSICDNFGGIFFYIYRYTLKSNTMPRLTIGRAAVEISSYHQGMKVPTFCIRHKPSLISDKNKYFEIHGIVFPGTSNANRIYFIGFDSHTATTSIIMASKDQNHFTRFCAMVTRPHFEDGKIFSANALFDRVDDVSFDEVSNNIGIISEEEFLSNKSISVQIERIRNYGPKNGVGCYLIN